MKLCLANNVGGLLHGFTTDTGFAGLSLQVWYQHEFFSLVMVYGARVNVAGTCQGAREW